MKNKALLFTFLLILLSVGGYYTYNYLSQPKSVSYWNLVPATAVGVYQRSGCDKCVDSIKNVPWIKIFKDKLLRTASGDTVFMSTVLKLANKAQLVSIHRTTKSDFDFIFYTSLDEVIEQAQLEMRSTRVQKRERTFDGMVIHERIFNTNTLAWVEKESYAAWSLSSILIEDVIRATNRQGENSFKNTLGDVAGLPTVKNDGGEIFLNLKEFRSWLNGFNENASLNFPSLGKRSLLDIKRSGTSLILNGFSAADSADQQSLLSVFEGQAPVAFNFKRFVSNDAQYVVAFGFSDPKLLGEKLQNGLSDAERSSFFKILNLSDEDVKKLYEGLGQELIVVSIETMAGQSEQVLMVDVKGESTWVSTLDRIAKNTSSDTVFVEPYSSYTLKKVPIGGLIELVFPILSKKYSELYYTQLGNAILISEDLRALKMSLEDFDQENTWGKSVDKNRFLESTLLESNISFFVDPERCRKLIQEALNPAWRGLYSSSVLTTGLGLSAAQFSFLNSNFYTNLHFTFMDGVSSKESKKDRHVVVSLASGINSRAFVLKNHNDKSQEILIQDSSQQVYLLNTKGEILWQKKLDGFIKGNVEQIDYFLNGKLQALISTEKSLHVIDRLGNYVRPFPAELPFANEMVRVVDYDHSRNYRFLLADKQGVVHMVDKNAALLEGWKGLKMGGELVVEPKHFRILAKDYIAVLEKSGEFTLYSRRGEQLKGFPVNLKGRPLSNFYYDEGNKSEKAGFVFVNADGYRVKISLTGEEVSRETLMKTSLETQFRLISEDNEKSYVIVRQDGKALAILSDKLEQLVVNEFVGLNKSSVRNFDFGSGKIFYTIIDLEQRLGYVYNNQGVLLTTLPIECDDLSLMWSQGNLWMITTLGSQLTMTILE